MTLPEDSLATLRTWQPPDAGQDGLRTAFVEHLVAHRDGVWKDTGPAHLTASALVLDEPGERVLLTLHRKGGFWVQTGGHCERGDATLADAALREATEESGIAGLRLLPGGPVDLDRHRLAAAFGACREHLDVRYVALAPAGAAPVVGDESHDVAWFPADALPDAAVDDLQRLVDRARSALVAAARA